jgi:hypothetical protein
MFIFDNTALILKSGLAALSVGAALPWLSRAFVFQTLQRSTTHAAFLFLGGLGTMGYGIHTFNVADDRDAKELESYLENLESFVPNGEPITTAVRTDAGEIVEVKAPTNRPEEDKARRMEQRFISKYAAQADILKVKGPECHTNCHGYVFTGGQYWLGGLQVHKILAGNGYTDTSLPQPGDIVIYRNGEDITHTAIVRTVTKEKVIAESKWGGLGVYMHPVDVSPYGTTYTFYRTARSSHCLANFHPHPDLSNPAKHLSP